ncbi:MAG TPA: Panacea domain-containing protein [Dehalococcoidia bacterium]|nr:Panacea domain-containing protein [Dehalococcoidia bacterium]
MAKATHKVYSLESADKKLAEMIVYIAQRSGDDDKFGAVKLNKILYYADFIAYRRLGHAISGTEYQHVEEGPAPRRLVPVRNELAQTGAITLYEQEHFGRVQQRIKAERLPDLSLFTLDEIAILDEVLQELRPLNGKEVSERSHREPGWKLTEDLQTIPYRTAWLSPEPMDEEQIETAIEIARRHGISAQPDGIA